MFLQIITILILIVLAVIVVELRKIKVTISDLNSQIGGLKQEKKPTKSNQKVGENWWETELPDIKVPMSILKNKNGKPDGGDLSTNQKIIEKVLKAFNIGVREMNKPYVGPAVTQFTFKPEINVKMQDIVDLQNNFALELASNSIRIDAPIPGTNFVGIEMPNQVKALVTLKGELEDKKYKEAKGELVIPFGRDIKYEPWYINLFDLPHLLIGGCTNSGKSSFLHSTIISLLTKHTPNTLRFIMVDPKRVEFQMYNSLPHMLTPVITDIEKTLVAFKWCIGEMERRFEILSNAGKRNIAEYNEIASHKMPYIIFMIDELADLMCVAAEDIETCIIKLAQMSRAVGIHLIIGTQRPSENVITGLMKANIPGRLAFSTASSVDSENILDIAGAEQLIGLGDSLFMNAEMVKPVRLQSPFVSDEEMNEVMSFIRQKSSGYQEIDTIAQLTRIEPDELLEEAKKIVLETGKASASYLQRRLSIGYNRSAHLIDQLEGLGIVGPENGAKPREVFYE